MNKYTDVPGISEDEECYLSSQNTNKFQDIRSYDRVRGLIYHAVQQHSCSANEAVTLEANLE